ncbi:Tetraacyldisaccharide 4'-kinase [Fundidesulfovibrio magnetotacticus]|uniref:Tetraacyldisaccharide 4'-kinase n=1 Tax=Fundidesulfovibrio magnetotacticus TaxID=2730080 RepID=A0A6V8LR45_9BACT|nr:tetraacyldisaccharide 4'-kinase [Fundidesulfovibrio magnetotacticus]GFK93031.1 Tetraacyldisaccharide 4'-kinase [Fundidesulfovibrio magnetotacticus]
MQELHAWQQRLRPLFTPAGAAASLAARLRRALHEKGPLPSWKPPAPAVGVCGIDPEARGKVLVSAWLLGWAAARGLTPVLLAGPGEGSPQHMPLSVKPDTPPAECGAEAALLARYRPEAVILVDDKPARAGKSAWNAVKPDLFLLHGMFSRPELRRDADIVLLGPRDLDKGWNRVFPAGDWAEGAHALGRASCFILHAWPDEFALRRPLAERRLGHLGRPVFTVHPGIWRLRRSDGLHAENLGGEPYVLVAAQSNQEVAAKAAQAFLGLPPRMSVTFPASHRFTKQDLAQVAAEAARMRCPHVLATPEAALRMGEVPGRELWTFDPDVVLGPCLLGGERFGPWWEGLWRSLAGA